MTYQELQLESQWDKTFQQSDAVEYEKVMFDTNYGITLAADLYDGGGKNAIDWAMLADFFTRSFQ